MPSPIRNFAWRAWLMFFGCCMLSFVGYGLIVNTPGLYFVSLSKVLGISRAQIAFTSTISAVASAAVLLFAGKAMKLID